MKRIFFSPDNARVDLAWSVLDAAAVPCEIRKEAVSQAIMGMPFVPELWVLRDDDYETARRLLRSAAALRPGCGGDQGAAPAARGESGAERPADCGSPSIGTGQPAVVCPAGGAPDDYRPALRLIGPISLLVFLAVRLPAMLWDNASRTRRVQSTRCLSLISLRTPLAKLAWVVFWLLVSPVILTLVALLARLVRSFLPH